jgi:hypothetical protein
MHQGATTENDTVTDVDVAGHCRVVRHNDLIANDAIMRHVHITHQQIARANGGHAAVLDCTPMQGHALTDGIVIPNDKLGWLACVLFILAILTHRGELINVIPTANVRRSFYHGVRTNDGS